MFTTRTQARHNQKQRGQHQLLLGICGAATAERRGDDSEGGCRPRFALSLVAVRAFRPAPSPTSSALVFLVIGPTSTLPTVAFFAPLPAATPPPVIVWITSLTGQILPAPAPCARGILRSSNVVLSGNLIHLAKPSTSQVKIEAVLVPHLASALASPILSTFYEARVAVQADYAIVKFHPVQVPQRSLRVVDGVVLDKAETTGRLLEFVESHYDALHLPRAVEEVIDLRFRCEV